MAQAVTPEQIKFGYQCFYRCDQCFRNVYENYQWFNFSHLIEQSEQDDSKCPYCKAEIDFDLSAIDKPTNISPAILKFPSKDYAFVFKTDQSVLTTVTIIINGTAGKILEINWGDTNKTITTLTGANQTITHDYNKQDYYYIKIFCEQNILTNFRINSSKLCLYIPSSNTQTLLNYLYLQDNNLSNSVPPLSNLTALNEIRFNVNNLSGNFPSISQLISLKKIQMNSNQFTGNLPHPLLCTSLLYYNFAVNNFSGTIPSFASNTAIEQIRIQENSLTGTIPSLANNINLLEIYLSKNNLTGSIPDLSNNISLELLRANKNSLNNYTASTLALSLIDFRLKINLLPSSAINQILADFVTNLAARPIAGIIYLHGTGNQPPTGQGLIDKAAIIAHGWTVLTN